MSIKGDMHDRYTPEQDRRLLKLRKEGLEIAIIAERFNRPRKQIERRLRKLMEEEKRTSHEANHRQHQPARARLEP